MTGDRDLVSAMSIRKVPDPVLRQEARPVSRVNHKIQELMRGMVRAMREAGGVGLAAPQVGVPRRVIVVEIDDRLMVMANPEVLESDGSQVDWEGCLSVPGYLGLVERPARVRIGGLDDRGRRVWVEGEDLTARALMHEIDHLDGMLFLDRAEKVIELPPAASLRLAFMGSPEFARVHLEHLLRNGCNVVGVVTQPDRPRGRGHRVSPTPVKELALDRGIDVLSPDRVRDARILVAGWRPDVIVTCAYGQILPSSILGIPPRGSINVHASLLPMYRGAAPIQRAIMDGQTVTGVSIMLMDEGMDTGPVLDSRPVEIEPGDDAGTVHDKLAAAGSGLLLEVLNRVALGGVQPRPQEGDATYAPALHPADLVIDWSWPATRIHNLVRALSPAPGARTTWEGRPLKIFRTGTAGDADARPGRPGTVIDAGGDGLLVVTGPAGRGRLVLLEVSPAGRPRMTGRDFGNGYDVVGRVLGGGPESES